MEVKIFEKSLVKIKDLKTLKHDQTKNFEDLRLTDKGFGPFQTLGPLIVQ